MGKLLFGLMFALMLTGVPIAFSIALATAGLLYFTGLNSLILVAQKMLVGMDSFVCLAVPLFVLTGYLMDSCGLSKRLVDWVNCLCGRFPGSIGLVTIVTCTIFASLVGSGPATIAAVGALMMPALIQSGYKPRTAAGMVAASGALGPIIPPSVGMIVYGSTMNLSIPKMFIAAIVPGLLLALSLAIVNFFISKREKLKASDRIYTVREKILVTWKALPALIMPVIILGGIYGGIFTPTEAAVVSTIYSLILGICLGELRIDTLGKILLRTVETSAMIMLILGVSNLFGWILAVAKIPQVIANAAVPLLRTPMVYLIVLYILMVVVGCLMETLTSIIIIAPIIVPIGIQLGLDPLVVGMVFCINLILGIVTPPFGVNLFTAVSTTGISYNDIVKGATPFIIALMLTALIITLCPPIILWLPSIAFA